MNFQHYNRIPDTGPPCSIGRAPTALALPYRSTRTASRAAECAGRPPFGPGKPAQPSVRLSKKHRERFKLHPVVDLYNIANSNTVTAVIASYGSNYLKPSTILGQRLVKFGLAH